MHISQNIYAIKLRKRQITFITMQYINMHMHMNYPLCLLFIQQHLIVVLAGFKELELVLHCDHNILTIFPPFF